MKNQDVWSTMRDFEAGRVPEPEDTDKRKGWMINGSFLDFAEPVTLRQAEAMNKMLQDKLWGQRNESN